MKKGRQDRIAETLTKKWRRMEKRVENWNQVHSYKLNTKFLKTNIQLLRSI